MKNNFILKTFFITLLGLFLATNAMAKNTPFTNQQGEGHKVMATACKPASGTTDLDINNVRARINTGGDMWWDLQSVAKYEIPKGSKKHSMFSGALWMAGIDVNGQLKCAAQRYRGTGNDFWTGPLTTDGTASITSEQCDYYDKHYKITRAEVDQFVAWFNDPSAFPGYSVPASIINWPAHGNVALGEPKDLAPFFDNNANGEYEIQDGDYPYYDLYGTIDCHQGDGDRILYGDQTLWWVFNDKGNVHSETKGSPIGMEIRAQAFAFTTNDEINNMTFYNYQMINRSTYTLTGTYFSQWVDADLGFSDDDFTGCDVQRGLGYVYNGKSVDGSGKPDHYGANPPAVGVDFFQGPYMDKDLMDNPKGIDEGINGVNFGDGEIDNERFGMRRFVYHNRDGSNSAITDPIIAPHYYNLLRGIWKDNTRMLYGGNGHVSDPKACGPECDFMFPGNTDPQHWGTGYQIPNCNINDWTEETMGNLPLDRRFMHSAGPFTLEPNSVNFITVGIPWARATSGGPFASVNLLKMADDKCQSLFDNCFDILDGPDAPELTIQELDRELIIMIGNKYLTSNNYKEVYQETDPIIADSAVSVAYNYTPVDTIGGVIQYECETLITITHFDRLYRFEGYMVYQCKDATVTVADLENPDLARLAAQCDIKNGVSRIINYEFDESLSASIPKEKVNGANLGIKHSYQVYDDLFATNNKRLINHKKYYYMAIAYAYNNYKNYDPTDPLQLDGQKLPFKAGRKTGIGTSINAYSAIPHIPSPENGGTIIQAQYGYGPKITRIEGQGNGGNILDLTPESIDQLMSVSSAPFIILNPTYENNKGPVDIRVVDPLNVPDGDFTLKFNKDLVPSIDSASWVLTNTTTGQQWTSDKTIKVGNEQIITEIGLSIFIQQAVVPFFEISSEVCWDSLNNGFQEATTVYADSSKKWFGGVPDIDGSLDAFNWIRSGSDPASYGGKDDDEVYEKVLMGNSAFWASYQGLTGQIAGGTWAPFRLTTYERYGPGWGGDDGPMNTNQMVFNMLRNTESVDVVLTTDQSKWTRCPVVETCDNDLYASPHVNYLSEGGALKLSLRKHKSISKTGVYATGTSASSNPADANFISADGMGWFPGYVINVETGERLNVVFGENSWLQGENGRDMLFNPTENMVTNLYQVLFGGMHYLYVLRHSGDGPTDMPAYDYGQRSYDKLVTGNKIDKRVVYANATWTTLAMKQPNVDWLNNECKIRLRVNRPYKANYSTYGATTPQNDNLPMYQFSTKDLMTINNDLASAKSALDLISVVPNPYYAFSAYEANQLDSRVKITNLPQKCEITIYTISGTLVRRYTKDDIITSLDWDLKNSQNIPVGSGVYLIHVNVEGVGEKVVKFFGTMRPVDLDSY
ncbi:MAG: T9SS C-terminal target domain-containing protein [Bacteroidota bacterium]